jgi:hypothetical protein
MLQVYILGVSDAKNSYTSPRPILPKRAVIADTASLHTIFISPRRLEKM